MIQSTPTLRYVYGNNEEEFVFCHKGRPFAVLSSPHFSIPEATYIDHLLVKELGLKMNDIQCKKISFCGQKRRLLGKISCSIQCVKSGAIVGSFHLTANVIQNLNLHFDTHCIAGVKMTALLHGNADCVESINCTSSGAPSPARSDTSTGSHASIPSDCSTPTRSLLQRIAGGHQSPSEESPPRPATPPSPRRSPPGFPPSPPVDVTCLVTAERNASVPQRPECSQQLCLRQSLDLSQQLPVLWPGLQRSLLFLSPPIQMTEGAKGRQRTVTSQPHCTLAMLTAVSVLFCTISYTNTSDSYQPLSEYHS